MTLTEVVALSLAVLFVATSETALGPAAANEVEYVGLLPDTELPPAHAQVVIGPPTFVAEQRVVAPTVTGFGVQLTVIFGARTTTGGNGETTIEACAFAQPSALQTSSVIVRVPAIA
ncbi:MAG: hypothetical protein O3A10_14360 [Chloroflexi bacterium]|nr:hypothetical protein [Chloroflexota bacterium]MDA1147882.1 hypothetical protein [Chloroflexota bacterium]